MVEGPHGSLRATAVQSIEEVGTNKDGVLYEVKINIKPSPGRLDNTRAKRAVAATQFPRFSRNIIFRASEVIKIEKVGMSGALQTTVFTVLVPKNPREHIPLGAPIAGRITEREFVDTK